MIYLCEMVGIYVKMIKFIKSLLLDVKNVFNFKKAFKDEEVKFRLVTTLKIFAIPLLSMIASYFIITTMLNVNLLFFKVNGYDKFPQFQTLYYEFITKKIFDILPVIGLFLIAVLFSGLYVSYLLIRPFKIIGDYCEGFCNGLKVSYDPGFFTDLKLLSRFSEWFFSSIDIFYKNGQKLVMDVPRKFTRIHKPVFENNFFLQYSIFLVIISTSSSIFTYALSIEIYSDVVDLAYRTLNPSASVSVFLNEQANLFESIQVIVICINAIMSMALILDLYSKVAGASFGFFATMRSFIKGNYDSRVHLVGYYYIRPHSRKLNKYLDKVQKDFKEKGNGE